MPVRVLGLHAQNRRFLRLGGAAACPFVGCAPRNDRLWESQMRFGDAWLQETHNLGPAETEFDGEISVFDMADGEPAYQLQRLCAMGAIIRNQVERRIKGKRDQGEHDWRERLDEALNEPVTDELEERARQEKVAALAEIFASRVSVLVGPPEPARPSCCKFCARSRR
jgi:hypothetical protein